MAGRDFLADIYTPSFLMGLCEGLTDFQSQGALRPFIGQWMRVRGVLENATPNPALGAAGVTIAFPSDDNQRREAFLWFTRDMDGIAKVGVDDVIWAEGRIQTILSHRIVLEECGLIDPRVAGTLEVGHQARELQKTIEASDKNWGGLVTQLNRVPPQFKKEQDEASERGAPATVPDKRKNLAPAEMEKFCKLLLEGWPSTTERVAHAKAVAFFPENKVPKHAFLDLFRSIRGDKKPGPQPKTR